MKCFSRKCLVVTVAVLLAGCGPSVSELKEEATRKAKDLEKAKIEALQIKASNTLNDPVSAQFRNVKLLADGTSICGEINGKNQYGGYVGFRTFAATEAGNTYIIRTFPMQLMKTLLPLTEKDRMKAAVQYFMQILMSGGARMDDSGVVMDLDAMSRFQHWKECLQN